MGRTVSDDNGRQVEESPPAKFGRLLEESLIGAIEFVIRYLRTAFACVFCPLRIIEEMGSTDSTQQYTRPYTFFIIACLFGGVALTHTALTPALYGRSVIASLETRLHVDSPWDVIYVTVPIAIMVLPSVFIVSYTVFSEKRLLRGTHVRVLCFSSGCQLILTLLLTLFVTVYAWSKKITITDPMQEVYSGNESRVIPFIIIFLASIPLIGALPLIYRLLQLHNEATRFTRRLAKMGYAISISVIMYVAAQFGSKIPGYLEQFREMDRASIPGLALGLPNAEIFSATVSKTTGEMNFGLLVMNDTDYQRAFVPYDHELFVMVRLELGDEPIFRRSVASHIIRWKEDEPIVWLEPGETTWLEFNTDKNEDLAVYLNAEYDEDFELNTRKQYVIRCEVQFDGKSFSVFEVEAWGNIRVLDQ